MPLYEYLCRDCGRDFERLESLHSRGAEPPTCRACGSARVERIEYSRVAVGHGSAPAASSEGACCNPGGF